MNGSKSFWRMLGLWVVMIATGASTCFAAAALRVQQQEKSAYGESPSPCYVNPTFVTPNFVKPDQVAPLIDREDVLLPTPEDKSSRFVKPVFMAPVFETPRFVRPTYQSCATLQMAPVFKAESAFSPFKGVAQLKTISETNATPLAMEAPREQTHAESAPVTNRNTYAYVPPVKRPEEDCCSGGIKSPTPSAPVSSAEPSKVEGSVTPIIR